MTTAMLGCALFVFALTSGPPLVARPAPALRAARLLATAIPPPEPPQSTEADPPLDPLPPVGETLRTLRPERVTVQTVDLEAPEPFSPINPDATFVDLFRSCTPYIKMHQGNIMVIHIASEALERNDLFDALMEEIAALALLGVKPVLVVGIHRQVDDALRARQLPLPPFGDGTMRVTDEATMRIVQEVNGFMRSRVEGALARGRSRSGPGGSVGVDVVGGNFFYTAQPVGVRNGVDYGFTGEVRSVDTPKVSQHLDAGEIVLMTALGYSASGTVFNVRTEQIAASAAASLGASKLIYLTPQRLMEASEMPLTTTPAGEVGSAEGGSEGGASTAPRRAELYEHVLFSMRIAEARKLLEHVCTLERCELLEEPETSAAAKARAAEAAAEPAGPAGSEAPTSTEPAAPDAEAAAAAEATAEHGVADVADPTNAADVANAADAANAAAAEPPTEASVITAPSSSASAGTATPAAPAELSAPMVAGGDANVFDLVGYCIKALEKGVTRGHLLPPQPGALIQELYTTDGCGTLISRDVYDGIRLATAADVPGILSLIEPLEARGILVKRPPEVLARDVHMGFYYVYTRDDTIIACAQLKRYSDTHAEVGCLVVQSQYRRQGCGDAMLGFLERTAAAAGVEQLFALSTHTMQWFLERGFSPAALEQLPARRVAVYNHERGSKIYMKSLMSNRQLDAEELFWTESLSRSQAQAGATYRSRR